MSPNRQHSHPLAGGRLIALYVGGAILLAVLATVLQHA
jgi:hypothetical protein